MAPLKVLTPKEKQFWDDNGYIKLSGIFSDSEFQEISDAYDELFNRKHRESKAGLEAAWGGEDMKKEIGHVNYSVKSIHNLQMHSATFSRLIMNSKLLDALEDIMDTKDILLHHTKAHIKPPEKGALYLMHQDYHYFPFKNHTMLAVFLHLDDTTPENGGLAVYPGSHKLGPLEDHGVTDEKGEQFHYVDPKKYPLSKAMPVYAKKGEIIVFSYLLLHGSYLNQSTRNRRMFLMQVRAADDEPTKDVHKSPCQDFVLRGRNVKRDATMSSRFSH